MDKTKKIGKNAGSYTVCYLQMPSNEIELAREETRVVAWGFKSYGSAQRYKDFYSGVDGAYGMINLMASKRLGTIYIHNLSFYAKTIMEELLGYGYNNVLTKEELKEPNTFYAERNTVNTLVGVMPGSTYYKLSVNTGKKVISFFCAKHILSNLSHDKLAQDFGITFPNFESNYWAVPEIPTQMLDNISTHIDVIGNALSMIVKHYDLKRTISAMAMNDFRKYINNLAPTTFRPRVEVQGQLVKADYFTYLFGGKCDGWRGQYDVMSQRHRMVVENSYRGGYTAGKQELMGVHIKTPNGVAYDANSMYPSIAIDNYFPIGKGYDQPKKEWKHICTFYELSISYAAPKKQYKGKVCPMFRRKNGDRAWKDMVWDEVHYMTQEELHFIQKYYDIDFYITRRVYFEGVKVFNKWLTERKNRKENATHPFEIQAHKNIYNNLFGKFAQRYYGPELELDENGDEQEKGEFHIGVASYITTYARLHLWSVIMANYDRWVYSDTDSIWLTDGPLNGAKLDNTAFGCWKIEKQFTEMKILKRKTYQYTDKATQTTILIASGNTNSKQASDYSYEEFKLGLTMKAASRQPINIKGGRTYIYKDYTLSIEEN